MAFPKAEMPKADRSATAISTLPCRLISIYLPQFHPIAENDLWWGKGFTEWTNVAKAKPLFPHHYQPHIPSELGFYDLRLPAIQVAQAQLAAEFGIEGFCYYHYWFGGKRLLERPLNAILRSGNPDFPFCLCWANENWTRRWDGQEQQILMKQVYSSMDDLEHIRWLIPVFNDPRYIRIDNRPLFLVYRALNLPSPIETTRLWRAEAKKAGVGELFLCRVESFAAETGNPADVGFDAAVEFQPQWGNLGTPLQRSLGSRLLSRLRLTKRHQTNQLVFDYRSVVERMLRKGEPPYPRFPCVVPSWDNSARRSQGAVILHNSTPELFKTWLSEVIARSRTRRSEERLIFINAWNEWGEGNHLEPDLRFGRGYLEATRQALLENAAQMVADRQLPLCIPKTQQRSVGFRTL